MRGEIWTGAKHIVMEECDVGDSGWEAIRLASAARQPSGGHMCPH